VILDQHPHWVNYVKPPAFTGTVRIPTEKALGFWYSEREPQLPHPGQFVDESWDAGERETVARYLESVPFTESWRGYSRCRICGLSPLGYREHADGTYLWPEGFPHYVREHSVRPPAVFIEHVLVASERRFNPR
jgi:hypothetical protein